MDVGTKMAGGQSWDTYHIVWTDKGGYMRFRVAGERSAKMMGLGNI